MPQRTATIESLAKAFAVVKEMQADGLEWGEGYRPLGRQALTEIIQGRMAEAVDYWLDSLDGLATRDRRFFKSCSSSAKLACAMARSSNPRLLRKLWHTRLDQTFLRVSAPASAARAEAAMQAAPSAAR